MPGFRQIDHQERVCIAYFLSEGCSQGKIARYLERARSTIKREIERNGYRDAQGKWHYDPEQATRRWKHRKASARYGKDFRRFYRKLKPGVVGIPPKREAYWQGYRYRPELQFRILRMRFPTKWKDKLRFERHSWWKRKAKRKPELFRTYIAPLFPEHRKRKQIYRWWKYRRGRDRFTTRRKARSWNCFWFTRWRFDKRKNRYRRPPYSYWPPGCPPLSVFLQVEQPKVSTQSYKEPLKPSYPKPESFGMALLCPEYSNSRHFSKNETLLGVDKSVRFRKSLIFS